MIDSALQGGQWELQRAAGMLDVELSDAAADRLLKFEQLLQKWSRIYNLTGLRDAEAVRHGHVLDSLALVAPLVRWSGGRPMRVLDVGSGGGLPGAVLAIVQPDWGVTCVDAVGKKAAFVRQVAVELALPNLQSVHGRVEALAMPPFEVIAARAFASLALLVRLSRRLLAPGGAWVAMKGRRPDDEISALPSDIEVFHVEPVAVPGLDAHRCLIWMKIV